MTDFLKDFLAGGISGAIAISCGSPRNRIILAITYQHHNPLIRSGEAPRYSGIFDCMRRMYAEQGLATFWRGNLANVLRYFPTQAFNFAFKDSIKRFFPKYDSTTNFTLFFLTNMASGGLAGACSQCFLYPLDYARTRLASDVGSGQKTFNGLADCLVKTAKGPSGFFGLYNGFNYVVFSAIPYRAVLFGVYDSLSALNPYEKEYSILKNLASQFMIAQVAVLSSGYASSPFDTVRRRLQMQSELPREEWHYKGIVDCTKRILSDEGAAALFRYARLNAFRPLRSTILLMLYDEIKAIIT